MKNLLIVAQRVDIDDDITGFFVGWIREFSKHFNRVYVITMAKGTFALPENVFVYSLGKERGASKFSQLYSFYRLLFTLATKCSGIFCHMSPIFAVASWPVAFLFNKKIVLWYLHRSVTFRLKVANFLCYKIVTSTKQSLGLKNKKIIEVGHAIDTDYFRPVEKKWGGDMGEVRILSVARISPAKKHETAIEAAKILHAQGMKVRLNIVGKPVMAGDFEYLEKLKLLVANYGLRDQVVFSGFVPYSKVADYYKETDMAVNMTNGGTDKTVLEAMSAGCIVITSNPAFRQYLGEFAQNLYFEYEKPDQLAKQIKYIINLPDDQKKEIPEFLRNSVLEHHQLSKTIAKIATMF